MIKRICLIMMGLQVEFNHKITEGIADQAAALGYDVYSYSYLDNRCDDSENLRGEENIFNLINTEKFDGFIVRKGSFNKPWARERIKELCETAGKPYVDLDEEDTETEPFPLWNDRENFRLLTEHLLSVHGFRRIYCVTGTQGVHQSEERLEGYRKALREYGIEPKAEWEFYGDFWKDHAAETADKIADGRLEKPEAVAFASTVSADAFIRRLEEHGIYVPDDIAVTGYDCFREGVLSSPTITGVSGVNYSQGVHAVCRLHQRITGEIVQPVTLPPETVLIGESCGCNAKENQTFRWYKKELYAQLNNQYLFQSSGMLQHISSAGNADEFFSELLHFYYLIRGIEAVWLCLNLDWDGINNTETEEYRKEGYANRLYTYLHRYPDTDYQITLRDELPELLSVKGEPGMYYHFPLHYNDRCFGCIILRFQDSSYGPDELFQSWLDLVNNALETLRIRCFIHRFGDRAYLASVRDPLTGVYNRRGFEELSAEMYEHAVIHQEHLILVLVRVRKMQDIHKIFGGKTGDRILLTLADAISMTCQGNEVVCRYSTSSFFIVGTHSHNYTGKLTRHSEIIEYCLSKLADLESQHRIRVDIEQYAEIPSGQTIRQIVSQMDNRVRRLHIDEEKVQEHIRCLNELRQEIYQDPAKKWTVDTMARMTMLSRAYFQRMYKQCFGVSVSSDIIAARIALAKKLLLRKTLPIYRIASECGYSSEIYFMQQFKKETGMTPTQFQKESEMS